MPITFAPADPLDAQSAYGYGRFQRQQADRDFALRQQQVAQQASAASYGTANQAAAIDNQAREAGDALRQRQQEFALSRQPSEADAYAVRAQQAAVQQRFELQAWLQDQELSQAEKVRYQRMQNAVGSVLNGDYTNDEKKDLLTQLRTGIDAGKQRLERATTQQKLALEQQEVERGHRDAAMTKAFEATMTTGGPKTYPIELPDGSNAVAYFANPREGWKIHAPKAAAATSPEGGKFLSGKEIAADAEAYADVNFPPDKPDDHGKFVGYSPEQRQRWLEAMQTEHAKLSSGRGRQHQQSAADRGGATGNAPPPGGGTPEAPEARQARVIKLASRYQETAAVVERRADIPEAKRSEYAAAARQMQALVAAYGSTAEMPPAAREKADKLKALLANVPPAPGAAPRQAPLSYEGGFQ